VRSKRLFAVGAVIASLSLAGTACSATPKAEDNSSKQKTSLTAGWNQPFYSYNELSSNGNATANANIKYLMNEQFWYYDPQSELKANKSFGTYEKVSDNPLTVKYTVADGVKWSDGTPVDAADLLLCWASQSENLNTVTPDAVKTDDNGVPQTPKGKVFFNSTSPGLALVKETPKISDDNKTLTLVYTKPFADWSVDMSVSMPAHVVAEKGLGITDAQKAKDAFVKAVNDKDNVALEKMANFWNTGFDFTKMPTDKALALSDGAYLLKDYKENQFMTLVRNPDYKGEHKASIDTLTVRFNGDPMSQVQALQNGEIDLFSPQATTDVVKAAQKVKNAEIKGGTEGTFEHFDLKMGNGGPFDPKSYGGDAAKALLVRQAFLHALPRTEIVEKLIKPINPDATVRNSFILAEGFPGYDEAVKANGSSDYATTDPAMSQKLLKQAGVKTPIPVKVLFDKANTRRQNEFQIMKPALAKAGFNLIDLSDPNWGTLLPSSKYDAELFGWQSTSTAVSGDQATYVTGGQNNFVKYSNKNVDTLYDKLITTTDTTEQQQLQAQIDTQMFKDAIGLPIFQFPTATIWNKARVTGVEPALLAPTMFYGFWNWKVPGA
jgi:peptide/nickel transport system substrate-binding protein